MPCMALATVGCLEVTITAKLQSSWLIVFSHLLWIYEHIWRSEKQQNLESKREACSCRGSGMTGIKGLNFICSLWMDAE